MAEVALEIEIVTPEHKVYSGFASFAVFPGAEGELGIMPGHAPLLSQLRLGEVKIVTPKSTEYCIVSDGFIEIRQNHISVVAGYAEHARNIDPREAEVRRDSALKERDEARTDDARSAAEAKLKKAILRLSAAQKSAASTSR